MYFPSRHTRSLSCWRGNALTPLGSATRSGTEGALVPINSGFATTAGNLSGVPLLCRATFVGPARLSVTASTAANFDLATRVFANDMGLLEGGLTVLAIFMLLAAMVNREPLYIVFAAWLIVNARLGANSAGWDSVWLGHQVPTAWLDAMRKIIFASNFPLTVYLFTRLFQGDLAKYRGRPLMRTLELLYLPMFAAALLLPYRHFIPALWLCAFIGYGIIQAPSTTLRPFTNNAVVRPGLPIGRLAFNYVNYAQGAGGVLEVEIGGREPGTEFDQLVFTAPARVKALAGTLAVRLVNGFVPSIGDRFLVISGSIPSSPNRFTTTDLPALPAGRRWLVNYLGGATPGVELQVAVGP